MKYLSPDPFSTPANGDAYRDGWDRTFGDKPATTGDIPCIFCGATDHERLHAWGVEVQACPHVPPDRAYMCLNTTDRLT